MRLAPHLVLDDAEDLARVRMHDLPVGRLKNTSGITPTVEGLGGSLAGNSEVQNDWQFWEQNGSRRPLAEFVWEEIATCLDSVTTGAYLAACQRRGGTP